MFLTRITHVRITHDIVLNNNTCLMWAWHEQEPSCGTIPSCGTSTWHQCLLGTSAFLWLQAFFLWHVLNLNMMMSWHGLLAQVPFCGTSTFLTWAWTWAWHGMVLWHKCLLVAPVPSCGTSSFLWHQCLLVAPGLLNMSMAWHVLNNNACS